MKRCPCCGQVIPPAIQLHGPICQRIYNLLRGGPRTAEALRELVWGNRERSYSLIYAELKMVRRQLEAHHGLTITHPWRNGEYRLEAYCVNRRAA